MDNYKKFYSSNALLRRIKYLFFFPIYLLAKIIPKKNINLFGSMSGFDIADNSKYKFINEYKDNYYWITKNKTLLDSEILPSVNPIYAYSLKGLYLQLVAKNVFYTHKIDDFIAPLIMGSNITALWHGVPFKKIGDEANYSINRSKFKTLLIILEKKLFPYSNYMWCNNVICPEEQFMPRYVECFKSATPMVLIEQFPRILYAKKNVRENMIIYCPTYRKYREFEDLLEKIKIFSPEVEKWCIAHNIKIVIRPHPIDRSKLQNISIPNYLILDDSKDIYETITKYKVLITDYSSLYYDAEKLGCKVLFVADDIDEYDKEEEGLFPDFKEYIKKNCFTNFIDVIKVIQEIL